ncbi:aldo/keto reductase [Dactylonectria estremocensis]|uniref:Aldo/keto reductase n=1 Tax=Dactylonectria estremocensis TaxID=1079267 RepID=A0A9P9EUJ1_9HYPO|nr:aldo/keto reductase [Dactylonectria estremocensis]
MTPPATLPSRKLGKNGPKVTALGFGLMGLSVAYGSAGSDEDRFKVLDCAWEMGAVHWDSADVYGDNEDLLGKWFAKHPERRKDIFLATKFGGKFGPDAQGEFKFTVDSTPEYAREACERSLKRLGVDYIDLFYIHRLDEKTPIEKTVEELARLKNEGKIRYLGISECSSKSLRRAYAVHPIHAVQVEYNPWSLDIEGPSGTYLLKTARELGVAVVAYAPLGRGLLTGQYKSLDDFDADDARRTITRFQGDNFAKNLVLVDKFKDFAARKGCTASQMVLAWFLAQGDDIIPIPGTKKIKYLEENCDSLKVKLTPEEVQEIRDMVDAADIAGDRGVNFNQYADTPEL